MRHQRGTIYLLHLERPYGPGGGSNRRGTAQHYTGWAGGGARGLLRRLNEHGTERGSPLLLAARKAGITWVIARTWAGTRNRERQLKRQGGASRRCPLCGTKPRIIYNELPWNKDGSLSRSRTTDWQKAAVGVMTSAELIEHTQLRKDATGKARIVGVERVKAQPGQDAWTVMTLA